MGARRGIPMLLAALACAIFLSTTPAIAGSGNSALKTANVKTAGIALQYPKGWIALPLRKTQVAALARRLAKKNPVLARTLKEATARLETGTVFCAQDLAAGASGAYGSYVAVKVRSGGGFPRSLVEFNAGVIPLLENTGGTVIASSAVTVGTATSYRVDVLVPDSAGTLVRLAKVFMPRGRGYVLITIAALNDDAAVALTDTIIGSVHLI
jgi:hypothetical protein